MANVVATSKEIQEKLEEIVSRANKQIGYLNSLPKQIRDQMDYQIYEDMDFMLRYIKALHSMLEESVPKDVADGRVFNF